MPDYDIDITINDERWKNSIPKINAFTTGLIKTILDKTVQNADHLEISIVLADDPFVQNLNKTYRNKDKPTNVLSFPQTDIEEIEDAAHQPFLCLGDIIMAYETIKQESIDQGKTIKDHFTHMLVHGCLHLLHYDHQTEEEANTMESLEIEVLSNMGIKNPYEII